MRNGHVRSRSSKQSYARLRRRFDYAFAGLTARIGEAPERYPLTRFGRRRFVLLSYPYDVVYRMIDDNDVEIITVAHHARRPAYWRGR